MWVLALSPQHCSEWGQTCPRAQRGDRSLTVFSPVREINLALSIYTTTYFHATIISIIWSLTIFHYTFRGYLCSSDMSLKTKSVAQILYIFSHSQSYWQGCLLLFFFCFFCFFFFFSFLWLSFLRRWRTVVVRENHEEKQFQPVINRTEHIYRIYLFIYYKTIGDTFQVS